MISLTETYSLLKQHQLVNNAQAFSTHYLSRNKNWYSYQMHVGRGWTFGAVVSCLQQVSNLHSTHANLTPAQSTALAQAHAQLRALLNDRYAVTGVCDTAVH